MDPNADFSRPSTFRAGILQLLTHDSSVMDTAAVVCVMQVKGDVAEVFKQVDKDNSGLIDAHELRDILVSLGPPGSEPTEEQLDQAMKEMDTNNSGTISYNEFVPWYTRSEARIRNNTRFIFDLFDLDKNGHIDKEEIGTLLRSLGNTITEAEVAEAISQLSPEAMEGDGVPFDEFREWYENSLFWTRQCEAANEAAEHCQSMFDGVKTGISELGNPDKPVRARPRTCVCLLAG